MPLYDYRCAGCGREFEALVATAAMADLERCPGCGSEARRQLSLIAARRGAKVTGVDIATNAILAARGRATAEGIDAPELVPALLELGCSHGQGFHFARPLEPAAALDYWLSRSD